MVEGSSADSSTSSITIVYSVGATVLLLLVVAVVVVIARIAVRYGIHGIYKICKQPMT